MNKNFILKDVINDVLPNGEDCWLFSATPITDNGWRSNDENVETEYFVFSAETEIVGVDLLADLEYGQYLWSPIQEDFDKPKIRNYHPIHD